MTPFPDLMVLNTGWLHTSVPGLCLPSLYSFSATSQARNNPKLKNIYFSLFYSSTCQSRGNDCAKAPPRPPKEEPTPFPSEPIFPPAALSQPQESKPFTGVAYRCNSMGNMESVKIFIAKRQLSSRVEDSQFQTWQYQ